MSKEVYLAKDNSTGIIGVLIDAGANYTIVNPDHTKISNSANYFVTINRKFPNDMLTDCNFTPLKTKAISVKKQDLFFSSLTDSLGVTVPSYTPNEKESFYNLIVSCMSDATDSELDSFLESLTVGVGLDFDYKQCLSVKTIDKLPDFIKKLESTKQITNEVDMNEGDVL